VTEREAEAYMRRRGSAKDEIFQSRAQKSSLTISLTNAPTRRSRAFQDQGMQPGGERGIQNQKIRKAP